MSKGGEILLNYIAADSFPQRWMILGSQIIEQNPSSDYVLH